MHDGTASLGYGFFIPIFFINIGLQAQAAGLIAAPLFTIAIIVIAVLTKIVGGGLGARLGGFNNRSSFQIGVGMVTRGEVALVIAGAGLAAGLVDASLFSILVVVTLATTLVTPPLLRLAFGKQAAADPTSEPVATLAVEGAAD
ncbi:hypothetical protein SE17_09445 [Kouleothrix aurantiaca]|uniref:Cation/H+ exchanger transmembrane domain-containing protein n=1 Tax=Kouleothrix aurantiaca TaxID=186479 RepID=A0A0P9D347_9CHLR|nr:hypothetical protein SE17_09445 [Kouleothrix aurantiaca]